MEERAPAPGRARLDVLDGLRGIAIAVVVLSHGWTLWSFGGIDHHGWARAVFRNGDAAVSVFLVISGFLTYRALAARGGLARMRIDVALLRRVLRVGPTLWLMLATVTVVAALDPKDPTTWAENRHSAFRAITYTYNWFVHDHLLQARYDLGHLWYLSVDMQAAVIVSGLLYLLRRRPVGLVFATGGFYLLLVWWRFHVTAMEPPLEVLVRTTARMDAFVVGVLAAGVVGLLARRPVEAAVAGRVVTAGLLALLPLLYWCASDPRGGGDASFLGWGGTLLELDLAVLVGAIALGGTSRLGAGLASARPLVALGRASLVIYLWHFPVFGFVARHGHGWDWWERGLLAVVLTVVVCVITDRVVERPVQRLLGSARWRGLDDGVAAYALDHVGARLRPGRQPPAQTRY